MARADAVVSPASPGQERLWFLDRMAPGVYVHHEAFRLSGAFDPGRMEAALTAVAARHCALRTTFRNGPGGLSQVVAAPTPVGLEVRPITDLTGFVSDECARSFDLAAGPVWRVVCGQIAPDDHLLVLGMHHIISDGWSVGILLDELGQLYANPSESLPDSPITYPEWAAREAGRGLSDDDLSWWEEALRGAPGTLDLPLDRNRPPVQTFEARSARLEVSQTTLNALDAWARPRRSTRFAAVMAATAAVLARWTAQDDLVVGVPLAARQDPDVERVVGFFAQTLLLRVDLSGDPSWDELLDRTRASLLGSLSHASVPFEKLVERLVTARDPAVTPLFNVAVALQDFPRADLCLDALEVEALELSPVAVPFDLLVQFHPRAGGALSITVDGNAALFDQSTVARFARHLARALEIAPASRDRVSQLDLLEPGELDRLIALSATAPAADPDVLWTDRLADAVAAQPARVALETAEEAITYAELGRRSDEVANSLAGKGIGGGAVVAVMMPRSPELLITLIGILKAGAAFLPLNPCDPERRLDRVLKDAAPDLVLDGPLAGGEVAVPGPRLGTPQNMTPRRAAAEDLAYVIYTSGSTGEPKGVQTLHRGLSNLAAAELGLLDVGPGDRVLSWFSPTFDAFLFEINLALLTGATLVLAPAEDLHPGPPLTKTLEQARVSVLCATPSVLAVTEPPPGTDLRIVAACAEPCPITVVRRWAGPGRAVLNCYGPTETSCCTNVGRCAPDGGRPNVGPPLAGVREYVVDGSGRLAPFGLPGELYIGGAAVGGGYRGADDLTAERFVADPVLPGAIAYRTGDRARLLPDGAVEILGRLDDQVKVRGHRVEPAEAAAVLREHPSVSDVAVLARPSTSGGPTSLVAYVVAGGADRTPPSGLKESELRAWAGAQVPAYLVPAHIVFLEELPLLSSGKLDRRALPEPSAIPAGGRAPSTRSEREVAAVWERVLGREVAADRGFFDSGGNSLLVVTLAEGLEQHLGVRFELADLFRWTTVMQQAAVVDQRVGRDAAAPAGYEL